MPVLVDSSLWVHQLRKNGDPAKRDRVNTLLENGEAAWGPVVRLELWRGVTNDAERKTLRRYEALLPDYEISSDVWTRSMQLADRARASGVAVPLADLLIFACATIHGLDVAHDDIHFERIDETRRVIPLTTCCVIAQNVSLLVRAQKIRAEDCVHTGAEQVRELQAEHDAPAEAVLDERAKAT